MNRYIGNPEKYCWDLGNKHPCWDRGVLIFREESYPGEHTICDINGNSLKLSDVQSGMFVKIRAKNVHWPGYDYLYTADGIWGMCFAIWIIKI